MALITKENIEKIDKERNSVHGKVRASYTYFQNGGKTIFQIDTYGSTTREQKDTISRTPQSLAKLFYIISVQYAIKPTCCSRETMFI